MKSQLHAFIEQLLSPPNGIENGEQQRQARLLSMLILVFTPIAVLIVFYHLEKTNFNPINSLVGFTAILGFVIAFFVSRTRYFQVAGFVVILTITGSVVASVTIDAISPVPLIYISFSPLVAILVLSTRDAIGFSIFNIFLAVGISPLVSRTATYEEDLVFLLIITFVVWIIVLLRRYDLKEIEEKNRDVLDLKQKQIETELENQRARLLSNFIQDVSHDIKTPLTIINTSTFILRRLLPVQDHDRIVRIQNQVKLLTKIVDDLIHMSQLDITYQLKLAPINVNLLLGEISTASETKAQSQLQSIQHNFDPQLPQILGDRDELHRCFTQLRLFQT
jgi:signal transduction histidine kinase